MRQIPVAPALAHRPATSQKIVLIQGTQMRAVLVSVERYAEFEAPARRDNR